MATPEEAVRIVGCLTKLREVIQEDCKEANAINANLQWWITHLNFQPPEMVATVARNAIAGAVKRMDEELGSGWFVESFAEDLRPDRRWTRTMANVLTDSGLIKAPPAA